MTLLPDIADQLAQAILEARKAQGPLSREGIAAACRPVIEAHVASELAKVKGKKGAKLPQDNGKVMPPEPEWVTAYSESIGYPLDGQKWCDIYEAKGWIVSGKARMKSWQAAVRTWKSSGWGAESRIYLGPPKQKPTDYRYAPEPQGDWRSTAMWVLKINELPAQWNAWADVPHDYRAKIAMAHQP